MKESTIFLLCAVLLFAGITIGTKSVSAEQTKKAIVVVSFGTSYADTRKVTIEACENRIKDTFPDYEVRRAFTSNIIINILKERDNIIVDTLDEALTKLQDEGFSEVVVQPLHLINGAEFDEVMSTIRKFESAFAKLEVGSPLLTHIDDYMAAADALKTQLPELKENEAVVLMGHGTHHPANSAYACLERVFEEQGMQNVFMGTVEGYPTLESVIKRLKQQQIEKVTLMPFMMVAGDHAQNDMAGDEDDSWKTILKKDGFAVDAYLHGVGENAAIQDIYVQHVQKAIEGEKEE